MENTANLGLFALHKIVSEYAKRIYADMKKTQRDTELRTSRLIMAQPENFLRSFLFIQDGLDQARKPFHATAPLIDRKSKTVAILP
jgi:molecular chaperone GrpE (heat shock protein)